MRIVVHPEAALEANESAEFYRQRSVAVAERYQSELASIFERILQSPQQFPVVFGTRRKSLLNRFPYAVIFEEHDGRVWIIAVAHTSREPFYWQNRVMAEPLL